MAICVQIDRSNSHLEALQGNNVENSHLEACPHGRTMVEF